MPWSGGVFTRTNGTYDGATVWASDAAASVKIQSSRHDTHDQDLANGINACVARDGSNTVTSLNLTATVNATTGVITIGGVNFANMIGSNIFIGGSGNFTLSGGSNVAIGGGLVNLSLGNGNSTFGSSAGAAITGNAHGNCAFGNLALFVATIGSSNSAFGNGALDGVTTGSSNSGVGDTAGSSITTGSQNLVLGAACQVPSATSNGQLSIQNAIYGISNTGQSNIVSTGNIGFYTTAPTARVHLPAGTATAGTAPLKLTSGTNLTTPENGAFEFDGTNLYFTVGGVRKTVTLT